MSPGDEYRRLRDALFVQASRHGAFAPRDVLKEVVPTKRLTDPVLRSRLLSALREACTVKGAGASERWSLRPTPRQRALADYEGEGTGTDLDRAIAGTGEFTPQALAAMVESAEDAQALAKVVGALDRAGALARGRNRLTALRSRLNALERAERTDRTLEAGFVGREAEIAAIEDWIGQPQAAPPLRTLHIEGQPGVGKSFLLERIVQLIRERPEILLVRLDFNRPSLFSGERDAVPNEVSRQIADALPRHAEHLRRLRLRHSERVVRAGDGVAELGTPRALMHAMIGIVAEEKRRLVFLLDTLEALQGRGASLVPELMEVLDAFAAPATIGIVVISAASGAVFAEDDPRVARLLRLERLAGVGAGDAAAANAAATEAAEVPAVAQRTRVRRPAPSAGPRPLVRVRPGSPTARTMPTEAGPADAPDPAAVAELRALLEAGERRDATRLLRERLAGAYPPESEAGLLLLGHQWLTGQWSAAAELAELLPDDALDAAPELPELEGRVLIEIWAEFRFGALAGRLADAGFRERVLELRGRSSRFGLTGAALDFALISGRAAEAARVPEAASAVAPYLAEGTAAMALAWSRLQRAEAIRGEMGLSFARDGADPAELTRLDFSVGVAPTSPDAAPIAALVGGVAAERGRGLLRHLGGLADRLDEAAALFVPAVGWADAEARNWSKRPQDVLATLTGMGLLADWAEGHAFFHTIPDLPRLARAATRWQQATAGHWAYNGPPPQGWEPHGRIGADALARGQALLEAPDAGPRADRMLRFWADPPGAGEAAGARVLSHRLAGRYAGLDDAATLEERTARLLADGVALTLSPPLAVLSETGVPAEVVFRDAGEFAG